MSDLGSPSSATQPAAAAAAGDDPDLGSPSSAAQQAAFVAHVFPGANEDCPFDDDGLEDDLTWPDGPTGEDAFSFLRDKLQLAEGIIKSKAQKEAAAAAAAAAAPDDISNSD